jgi:hypothetical protein
LTTSLRIYFETAFNSTRRCCAVSELDHVTVGPDRSAGPIHRHSPLWISLHSGHGGSS